MAYAALYPRIPRRNATLSRWLARASESICHILDTFGIRLRQRHAPELKAEIAFRPAGRGGPAAIAANKFHWIVLKMRQAQTFLATFENDDYRHENVGRYLSFGTAHAFGRCLYGPVADGRATGGSTYQLTLAAGAGVRSEPWGTNAFRGPISQARQRTRRFSGFPYRNADLGGLTSDRQSPAISAPKAAPDSQYDADKVGKYANVPPDGGRS